MGGFNILNVSDYQRRLDILANITPFKPGQFIAANQENILRLCDGQIEIAEEELRRWAKRHPEEGRNELSCRVVEANPLTIKILDYDVDNEQKVVREKWVRRQEFHRKKTEEKRLYP